MKKRFKYVQVSSCPILSAPVSVIDFRVSSLKLFSIYKYRRDMTHPDLGPADLMWSGSEALSPSNASGRQPVTLASWKSDGNIWNIQKPRHLEGNLEGNISGSPVHVILNFWTLALKRGTRDDAWLSHVPMRHALLYLLFQRCLRVLR